MPELKNNKLEKEIQLNESNENNESKEAHEKVDSSADVANLLEGVEMGEVSEKVTEKKDKKGDAKLTKKVAAVKKQKEPLARPLPSVNVMRRKAVQEMKKEEAGLVNSLPSDVVKNAEEYAEKIKKIRSLRQNIFNFVRSGVDKIKEFYLNLFGKRHGISEEKTENAS